MRRILLLVLLAAFFTGGAWAATCSPTMFIQAASVPSGGQGAAVAIAPIDSNASPDIVIVSQNPNGISVLLNNGDGTFGAPIVTPISTTVLSVAVGDLNGDTKADLVVGTYYEVLVLLGHGDGTFDAPVDYPINGGPVVGVLLGKFDANASLDIAAIGTYGGNVSVLLSNGNGTFAPAVSYPVGQPTALTAGDFNGDGHLDLAVTSGGSVGVLLGAGDGTFGSPTYFVAGASLSGIAAADLDGDTKLDLVATSGSFVSVLIGNGNGTFQAALEYPAGFSGGPVAIADFDLDGVPDVVVASPSGFGGSPAVAILRGLGAGALAPAETYATGSSLAGLAVGDLNGDGFPDAVAADPGLLSVSVFIDMPDGTLYAAPVSTIPQGPSSSFVQADFNEDGREDFAWLQYTSVTTVLGTSHGRFRSGVTLADPTLQQVMGIGAGDFTGNHHTDLVITDYSSVWIFPGNGNGSFGSPRDLFDSFALGAIQVGDFDGDGKPDIAFSQGCCGPPTNLIVLLGNGDGTFRPPLQTPLNTDARLILAADLNGDGHTDLVASSNTGTMLVPGNGDGTFSTPIVLETAQGSFSAATGDFDANGHADLLLSDGSSSVELFLADGSGALQPPVFIGVGGASGPLAVADFDGDGKLDFAVATGPTTLVLRGLGNGHFQTPLTFPTTFTPVFIATGDYDDNGRPDLASVTNQSITTLLNAKLGASIPFSVSVIVGSPVVFQASAGGGFGTITYQWRKGGVPLSDGGSILGSHTATLTIDPVAFTDAGSYDVVVTDSCTNATSNASTLSVEFDDVPLSNPFHTDIIKIATAGITTGCTATSYCPSASVSRAEMAVFLLKAEFGANHVPPPPPPTPIFPDVPADAFAAAWIDELATLGITGGCGDGHGDYCPNDPVTRGQMAVFLLKTLLGSGYVPPTATGIFADVPPGYFAIDWIENLYNRSITAGCGTAPLRYCPDEAVPREQMATFLVRTFLGP